MVSTGASTRFGEVFKMMQAEEVRFILHFTHLFIILKKYTKISIFSEFI